MEYKELTENIIGCADKVYNKLGYGFLESVYPLTQKATGSARLAARHARGAPREDVVIVNRIKYLVNPVNPVKKEQE